MRPPCQRVCSRSGSRPWRGWTVAPTCHQTIDWGASLADAPHPARSHPFPELLEAHPIESFGCTLCHGGQGAATTKAAAHGDVTFWEEPLLGEARAATYGLTRRELMEMRCNACHQGEAHVEGMPLLNEAKGLVERLKCARCHTIHGEGANKAPDLTLEGDRHPAHLHFPEGWTAPRTMLGWHIEHFLDPQAVTPNSDMPKHALDRRRAAALSLLVMSWCENRLPARWTPGGSK